MRMRVLVGCKSLISLWKDAQIHQFMVFAAQHHHLGFQRFHTCPVNENDVQINYAIVNHIFTLYIYIYIYIGDSVPSDYPADESSHLHMSAKNKFVSLTSKHSLIPVALASWVEPLLAPNARAFPGSSGASMPRTHAISATRFLLSPLTKTRAGLHHAVLRKHRGIHAEEVWVTRESIICVLIILERLSIHE